MEIALALIISITIGAFIGHAYCSILIGRSMKSTWEFASKDGPATFAYAMLMMISVATVTALILIGMHII